MPSTRLTANQVAYLEGLVRSHMKKTEKGLARLNRKPGQTEEEAKAFRDHLEGRIVWQQSVLRKLRSMKPDGEGHELPG